MHFISLIDTFDTVYMRELPAGLYGNSLIDLIEVQYSIMIEEALDRAQILCFVTYKS